MNTTLNNGTFNTSIYATALPPIHGSSCPCPAPNANNWFPYPGGGTLVTWNSTGSPQDAILWAVDFSGYLTAKPAILLAYLELVNPRN